MKRLIKVLIFALAAFFVWQGLISYEKEKTITGTGTIAADNDMNEENMESSDIEKRNSAENITEDSNIKENISEQLEKYYVYSTLNRKDRKLYEEIYLAIITFAKDAEISETNTDRISSLLDCVLADHPEIFYIDGFHCTTHTIGEEIVKVTFTAEYTHTENEVTVRKAEIDQKVTQILTALADTDDDYEKIKYLYEYLISNTEYDAKAPENQTITSVFLHNRSVCQGYAKAFQYLCHKAGLPSVLITGTVKEGAHAWNIVQSNGAWYHTDPTWGDAQYQTANASNSDAQHQTGNPAKGDTGQKINYDYLLIPTNHLLRTHIPDTPFPIPSCTATADNYYTRQNTWLDTTDDSRLTEIFNTARTEKQSTLTIKCATEEIHTRLHQTLITDQQIFNYIPQTKQIPYTSSPAQLTLTFYLQ